MLLIDISYWGLYKYITINNIYTLCEKNRGNTGENIGKDRGKYGESSIQSVFPGYDIYGTNEAYNFGSFSGFGFSIYLRMLLCTY